MKPLIIGMLLLLLVGCQSPPKVIHEATKEDVFAIKGIHSDEISIFGIKLGDDVKLVVENLGAPDKKSFFDEGNIANYEYSTSLGLNETGVIIHFENYIVTRMTFFPPFNQYLIGSTKIGDGKEAIYRNFGIPDEQGIEKSTGPINSRIFKYTTRGFEIFLTADGEKKFSMYKVE